MIRLALAVLAVAWLAPPQAQGPRFVSYDVYIDGGDAAVAAWQVEVVPAGDTKVVGVGNGDGPFSAKPAYYDARALQGGRIVIASFTTEEVKPGRIRVATLEMYVSGGDEAGTASRVMAAAAPGAERIPAEVELVRKGRTK